MKEKTIKRIMATLGLINQYPKYRCQDTLKKKKKLKETKKKRRKKKIL